VARLIFGLTTAAVFVAASYTPARLASGDAPIQPVQTVGWGEAAFELTVAADGSVLGLEPRGGRNPFLDALFAAVSAWRFTPARDDDLPIDTRVLVAGIWRPPELMAAAPPESFTTPAASPAVPRPTRLMPPSYPPNVIGDGMVVVELCVDEAGRIAEAQVVRSAGGFDGPALDAAREWRFQPATRAGRAVPAYVYLVFGFRQPVVVIK